MGENEDGIVLNLTPYEFKTKKEKPKNEVPHLDLPQQIVKEKEKKKRKKEGSETSSKDHKTYSKHPDKSKYIDPKDFLPISNLFNKNPEIPEVLVDTDAEKSQEDLFSTENVDDLLIGEKLKSNLKNHSNLTSLTKIQKLALPRLLTGKDAMIRSPTGSGKTFCYAIPVVDWLSKAQPAITRVSGPYVLVLVPTRELALQTLGVFQELCKCCIAIVPGMLIGGEKCKAEKARLRKGINVLIATPGRLIYHMKETSCLDLSHIEFLVLDEADRLLDMGFRETLREVIDMVSAKSKVKRQSILLSATLNSTVQDLVSVSLTDPIFIDSAEDDSKLTDQTDLDYTTPGSLTQYFIIVPAKLRLISLVVFIISKVLEKTGKAIVFTSSKNSVAFLSGAFRIAAKGCSISSEYKSFNLHGDMTQQERFEAFEKFKRSDSGVLFCTDVASRGLDIKKVDWVIHYDCPTLTDDYLHRTGRTARIGEAGNSLIFLLPSEVKYIQVLNKLKITLSEIKLPSILKFFAEGGRNTRIIEEKAQQLQNSIEESISESKELHQNAVLAYKSFIQGYATYPKTMKDIFHVKLLHLGHIAKSFGLKKAPVNAIASVQSSKKRKLKHAGQENVKRVKVDDVGEVVCGPRTKKVMHEMKKKKKKRNILVR